MILFSGYHTIDYTLQSKLFGFRKPKRVNSLSKDEALNVGTKILGETLVYGISASFLLYEYSKSQKKDTDRMNEIAKIKRNIHLYEEKTEAEIRNLKKIMIEFQDFFFRDVYWKNTDRSSVIRLFVDFFYISSVALYIFFLCSL